MTEKPLETEASSGKAGILEEYTLLKTPPVIVQIVEDATGRRFYHLVEPGLGSVGEAIRERVYNRILHDLSLLQKFAGLEDLGRGITEAYNLVLSLAKNLAAQVKREGKSVEEVALAVAYYIARDIVGYGRLDPLIRDPYIEDITCNGLHNPVFVYHSRYEWLTTEIVFDNPGELENIVMKLAIRSGQEPSLARPIVEGILKPEGYRVHLTLDTVSRRGHSFTIRKFRAEPFTIVELLRSRTIEPGIVAFLWIALQYKQGIVIYGPTGSGKTTLLNALTMLLPPEYKVVTIEDTPEIYLPFHENWSALYTRPSDAPGVQNVTLHSLLESGLRMRPDVIIVGEIRSREAHAFFQAISTGHGGVTTVHAESSETLISRLASPPMNVPKSLIAAARLFVNILRVEHKGRVVRRVTRVDETAGYNLELDAITFNKLYRWRRDSDSWVFLGARDSAFVKTVAELAATSPSDVWRDIEMRATVLKWAAEKNIDTLELYELVRNYLRDPETVYNKALAETEPYKLPAG